MKKMLIIIGIFCMLYSCGIKSDPEYKSQIDYNKAIHLV